MKSQYYKMTPVAHRRFKCWLITHNLSITQFAARCGCSRQYIHRVVTGMIHVTPSVRSLFHKGGYDLI